MPPRPSSPSIATSGIAGGGRFAAAPAIGTGTVAPDGGPSGSMRVLSGSIASLIAWILLGSELLDLAEEIVDRRAVGAILADVGVPHVALLVDDQAGRFGELVR